MKDKWTRYQHRKLAALAHFKRGQALLQCGLLLRRKRRSLVGYMADKRRNRQLSMYHRYQLQQQAKRHKGAAQHCPHFPAPGAAGAAGAA